MRLSDFDFPLPDECIALRPAEPRDSARCLVVRPDQRPMLVDDHVRGLPHYLRRGDVIIFNNTRVILARLFGIRRRAALEAKVEILLHKRQDGAHWIAFAKPGKRLAIGDKIDFSGSGSANFNAVVIEKSAQGDVLLRFDVHGAALDAAIASAGILPLPPYIAQKRPADAKDRIDYQTIYASADGAVAAPTAGLHVTPELLASLDAMGVERHEVTLHVGAGTFLPVKTENVRDHVMHSEWGQVSAVTAQAINAAKARGGRLIAVGTTSLRLLESAADERGLVQPFSDSTAIFITPGYRFKAVDMLMTNFHLPKSTLLMLVQAFCGQEPMRQAYAHAIREGYRFYSYGDASLLFRAQ